MKSDQRSGYRIRPSIADDVGEGSFPRLMVVVTDQEARIPTDIEKALLLFVVIDHFSNYRIWYCNYRIVLIFSRRSAIEMST